MEFEQNSCCIPLHRQNTAVPYQWTVGVGASYTRGPIPDFSLGVIDSLFGVSYSDGLLTATAAHIVRRTFIYPRRSFCVERPAWRFARRRRLSEVQTAAEDLLFY